MNLLYKAADVLKQARKLPPGPARNELRQVALALRWLAAHPQSPEREAQIARMLELQHGAEHANP
jgi:hypothetical protein